MTEKPQVSPRPVFELGTSRGLVRHVSLCQLVRYDRQASHG